MVLSNVVDWASGDGCGMTDSSVTCLKELLLRGVGKIPFQALAGGGWATFIQRKAWWPQKRTSRNLPKNVHKIHEIRGIEMEEMGLGNQPPTPGYACCEKPIPECHYVPNGVARTARPQGQAEQWLPRSFLSKYFFAGDVPQIGKYDSV